MFGAVSKSLRTQAHRDLTVTAIALKRYQLRHGKFPASLDALVPEFLPALPVDWMDGQPLRYRLKADGSFQRCSVGDNFRDDGGDGSVLSDRGSSFGLWQSRDAVWPAPATPEQVEAYREKQQNKKQ